MVAEGEGAMKVFNIYVGCDGDVESPGNQGEVVLPEDFLVRFAELTTKVETVLNGMNDTQVRFEKMSGNYTALTEKVNRFMSEVDEGLSSIQASLQNISGDIDRLESSAAEADQAHQSALADLQSKLDAALANQDAEVQRQVAEAVAAYDTEIAGKIANVRSQARALADRIPEPESPEEPTPTPEPEPTPEPTPEPEPTEPNPPTEPEGDRTFIP